MIRLQTALLLLFMLGAQAAGQSDPATQANDPAQPTAQSATQSDHDAKRGELPKPPGRLPDLCRHSDMVVVGWAATVEVGTELWAGHSRVMSRTQFRVERALLGEISSGEEVALRTAGGAMDGVQFGASGSPHIEEGDWFVLFLTTPPKRKFPIILYYRELPIEVVDVLPDEATLQSVLSNTCAANPDGVYAGRPFRLVLPGGLSRQELITIFGPDVGASQ